MIAGNIAMLICLGVVGVFLLLRIDIVMIIGVLLFITFFELSSGPIVWLYNAEIMQDKSMTIATFLNWIINLITSIILPIIKNHVTATKDYGWIFIVNAGLTFVGLLFILFFMKET